MRLVARAGNTHKYIHILKSRIKRVYDVCNFILRTRTVKINEGEEDKGKNRGGKLPEVFCYSDEKFHHVDWMIMSLEKCENEPAMPIDFEQSLRAEQPWRVVMTFRRVSYSIPRNFLSSNPLNPRKPSFLIARAQVRSLSFVLVTLSVAKKTPQLLAKIRNYRYIVLPTKRQKSIPPGCRTFPQFYSSRAILDLRGDRKISHVGYQLQYPRILIICSLRDTPKNRKFRGCTALQDKIIRTLKRQIPSVKF